MVVLGYDSTLPVTMEDMIHHTKAVTRAVNRAMVIGDMRSCPTRFPWRRPSAMQGASCRKPALTG